MRQGQHDNGALVFAVMLVLSSLAEMQERGGCEERAISQGIKAVTLVSPILSETKERAATAAQHWHYCDYRVIDIVVTGKDRGERMTCICCHWPCLDEQVIEFFLPAISHFGGVWTMLISPFISLLRVVLVLVQSYRTLEKQSGIITGYLWFGAIQCDKSQRVWWKSILKYANSQIMNLITTSFCHIPPSPRPSNCRPPEVCPFIFPLLLNLLPRYLSFFFPGSFVTAYTFLSCFSHNTLTNNIWRSSMGGYSCQNTEGIVESRLKVRFFLSMLLTHSDCQLQCLHVRHTSMLPSHLT